MRQFVVNAAHCPRCGACWHAGESCTCNFVPLFPDPESVLEIPVVNFLEEAGDDDDDMVVNTMRDLDGPLTLPPETDFAAEQRAERRRQERRRARQQPETASW